MNKITKQAVWAALGVFVVLVGIYGLGYSGFPVSDDEQLFAAAAQSIASGKGSTVPQLYGNDRLLGEYIPSGSLHIYLGAAVLKLLTHTPWGQVQAVYLLPILYTALTAALLMLILQIYDFQLHTSVITALLMGLTTIAWPYSQMFFREPLAMLLLTLVWLLALMVSDTDCPAIWPGVFSLLAIVLFIGALLTKVLLLAAVPGLIYLLWSLRVSVSWKKGLLGAVVCLVAVILLSQVVPPNRLTANFFGRLWQARGWFPFEEIPAALLAMLFTPGKGLLVYNPALLLLPLGWVKAKTDQRKMVIFALITAGSLMIAQAAAYGERWWTITWGTRFMLPALPLLIASLAPGIEFLLSSLKPPHRLLLWGGFGLGMLVQLGGVLVSNSAYTIDLYYGQYVLDMGDVLWSVKHAPLVVHWRLLLEGAEPNFAFWRSFVYSPGWTVGIVISCLFLIGTGAVAIRELLSGAANWFFRLWWAAAVILLVLPAMILSGYRPDPRYGAGREDLQMLADVFEEQLEPGDVVLVFPYLRTAWNHFFNFYRGEADWYSLPNTFPAGDVTSTMRLVDGLAEKYQRVWLVSETASWEPESTFVEGYLFQYGEVEKAAIFPQVDENLHLRLLLYDRLEP